MKFEFREVLKLACVCVCVVKVFVFACIQSLRNPRLRPAEGGSVCIYQSFKISSKQVQFVFEFGRSRPREEIWRPSRYCCLLL